MRGNTITLNMARWRVEETGNLYQYDYGQRLIISGVKLPVSYEVHFSNHDIGVSKTVIGDSTGVDIPDEYLLSGDNIHVWVFLHDGTDDGETEYHGIIRVTKRAKPIDVEPTPEQQDVITQTIAALNAGVESVEEIAGEIPQIIDDALTEAKESGEFDGKDGRDGRDGEPGADGFSPVANVTKIGDVATITVTDKDGTTSVEITDGHDGEPGEPGVDGVSPTVDVDSITGGHVITITDAQGSHSFDVMDGERGAQGDPGRDGADGVSPEITVTNITGGHRVTIVDAESTKTVDIMDGSDGAPGQDGADGYSPTITVTNITGGHRVTITDVNGTRTVDVMDGQKGEQGESGPKGDPGVGVPAGGTTGQVLKKKSGTDYDTEWGVDESAPVQDVQINGASIVGQDGTANIPSATSQVIGVTKIGSGLMVSNNTTMINTAPDNVIKAGSNVYEPITPSNQDKSVFYGLAKAAGDSTQSASSNPVGQYTNNAKESIRSMIGAENGDDIIKVQDTQPTTPATKIWMPATAPSGIEVPTYTEFQSGISTLNNQISDKQDAPASGAAAGKVLGLALVDGQLVPVWDGFPVSDVQVGGVSVLDQGVANVPYGTNSAYGAVKGREGWGIGIQNGEIYVNEAATSNIKNGTVSYKPIVPNHQHESVYYGLAKAAGADMASLSSVTVGQYPEAQRSAISQMLDAPETVSGTTPSITAKPGVRYVCGECATLTITAPASGIIDVTFESGSTPTVLTVTPPTGMTMKWIGDDPTALEANKTYEVNIKDGCLGMVVSWT